MCIANEEQDDRTNISVRNVSDLYLLLLLKSISYVLQLNTFDLNSSFQMNRDLNLFITLSIDHAL